MLSRSKELIGILDKIASGAERAVSA
jgi:hypothetical protein